MHRPVVSVFKGSAGAVSYFNGGSRGHGDAPRQCLQGRALWLRPAQDQTRARLEPRQGRRTVPPPPEHDSVRKHYYLYSINEVVAIACKTQLSTVIDCDIHVPACARSRVPTYTPVVVFVPGECDGKKQNYLPPSAATAGQLLTSLKAKLLDVSKVLQNQTKSMTCSWRDCEIFILFLPRLDPWLYTKIAPSLRKEMCCVCQ